MDLYKESTFINVNAAPKMQLKKFDYQTIAFVMGTHHLNFPSLCVTINGELFFSPHQPVTLCQQLEDEWQAYYFYTRQPILNIWDQIVAQSVKEAQTNLGQFRAPLRVATCGGYSFWSPNPGNHFGFWFFTPTCQDILVHDDQVDFTTTDRIGHTIHWTGRRQTGEAHLVTQARVDILADYVLRKATLTHKVALQLAGNILVQQRMNLKGSPRVDLPPLFPLDKWFYQEDLSATLSVLFGHSPELTAKRIELMHNYQEKKDEKTD